MKLTDPESPSMSVLQKLSDVVICNVIFTVFSLPLVTLGASTAALHACMQALSQDREESSIVKQFIKEFKRHFIRGTLAGLTLVAGGALLTVYRMAVMSMGGVMAQIYTVTYYSLCFLGILFTQFLYPALVSTDMGIKKLWSYTAKMTIARFPWAAACTGVTAAAIFITLFTGPRMLGMAPYLWSVFVAGAVTYINSLLFFKAQSSTSNLS